jgi:hypothetical protein
MRSFRSMSAVKLIQDLREVRLDAAPRAKSL